jgi:transcriptional regulator with XRE-family HTH domain
MSTLLAFPTSASRPDAGRTVSKAVVRAAQQLHVNQSELADILGVSRASASRLVSGSYVLDPARTKEWELALLFLRVYRSLDAVVGHEDDARTWLNNENTALGAVPLEFMKSAEGLVRTVHYLDAARGRI